MAIVGQEAAGSAGSAAAIGSTETTETTAVDNTVPRRRPGRPRFNDGVLDEVDDGTVRLSDSVVQTRLKKHHG